MIRIHARPGSLAIGALLAVVSIAVIGYVANTAVIYLVREKIYKRTLLFIDDSSMDAMTQLASGAQSSDDQEFVVRSKPQPFIKIDAFDEDAYCWSNQFSQYGAAGVLVFDANGDGRQDAYFCQDGQNWTRPTDSSGVLKKEPRYQHNGLYLNHGNDEQGRPRFKQLAKVAAVNTTFVKQELLVEDFLYPRHSVDDTLKRPGRSTNVAVAADFNNDGRLDLLVGNEPQGMFWSHPKTQRVLMQFVNPAGREAKRAKQPLSAMGLHLINYEPRHSLEDRRQSARGDEPEGANSLYLNTGDQDQDGIPEWRDASRETGIEGFRSTYSLSVADFDLDGDLDIFASNTCDMDYWIGGSKYWAGGANCMYINQLAQTGQLKFVEQAAQMDIDGVYDEDYPMPYYYRLRKIPYLPAEYSIWFMSYEPYQPEYLEINGQEGEHGQISWSSVVQDVNADGYPDIWVANDMGYLRLYLNDKGKRFKRTDHARSSRSGYWMTFAPADFDGDLREDLFVGNLGGAVMNHAFVTPDPYDLFDPVILNSTIFGQFYNDKHDTTHAFINGLDYQSQLLNQVRHSRVLPPDVTLPNNYRRHAPEGLRLPPFDPDSVNAYEFAWGATAFDVQNDGKLDLYYIGCLYGRGGGLFPISGTGPGRLLVNATTEQQKMRFVDLTAEHHLFNIEQLEYDRLNTHGYVYRRSPLQNWAKRDMVFSYDRSNWALQGPGIQEKVTNQDLIQTAENGRAVVAADLNGDGALDLILRNQGGYDSRSAESTNLKAMIDGRAQVIPAHNYNYPTPTQYEPGRTWMFLNTYQVNNWLEVRLVDDSPGSLNRDAIGARVILNGRLLAIKRCGNGGFLSNVSVPLHFGLGTENANELEIHWPDKQRSITKVNLDGVANRTVVISKTDGLRGGRS